jgi:hypothetical protein
VCSNLLFLARHNFLVAQLAANLRSPARQGVHTPSRIVDSTGSALVVETGLQKWVFY